MKNVTVTVNGMSCMNCVGKVQRGVEGLEGTQNVSVNLKGKYMTLDLDESVTTLGTVLETVKGLGFEAFEKKSTGLLGKLLKR